MILFKVIAYILLSIGVCTVVLAGIAAIVKKQMIIANMNLLLAMYYFCTGSLLYLYTLWETQDIFLQAFFDFNCGNCNNPIKKKLVCTANAYLSSKTTGASDK